MCPRSLDWALVLVLLTLSLTSTYGRKTATCEELGQQVYLLQVAEGSSFNKAIQVANDGPSCVPLRDLAIVIARNGDAFGDTPHALLGASGTTPAADTPPARSDADDCLGPNETFTVCHPSAAPSLKVLANGDAEWLDFNGDDALKLVLVAGGDSARGACTLDQLGEEKGGGGLVSGRGWALSGVAGATKDHTLLRSHRPEAGACDRGGLQDWSSDLCGGTGGPQWVVLPRDTWALLQGPGRGAVYEVVDLTSGQDSRASGAGPQASGAGPQASGEVPRDEEPGAGAAADECPAAPAAPADRREPGRRGALTVASFNAEWLFDGRGDPPASPWSGGAGGCGALGGEHGCSPAGALAHASRVADVIAALDADVLNLVEVEGCGMLRQLLSSPPLQAAGYAPYLLQGGDSYLRQNVGLLTRVDPYAPLTRAEDRRDYPLPGSSCGYSASGHSSGVSKLYTTRVEVAGGLKIALFGLHFKAFPTDPKSCAQREAQAAVVARLVRGAVAEGLEAVVLGDFNDHTAAEAELDAAGSRPTSRVLALLQDLDQDGALDLLSANSKLAKAERWTSWWDHAPPNGRDDGGPEHSQLDHILATPRLHACIQRVWVDHTHDPTLVSDHWPIAATFNVSLYYDRREDEQPNTNDTQHLEDAPTGGGERGDDSNTPHVLIALLVALAVIAAACGVLIPRAGFTWPGGDGLEWWRRAPSASSDGPGARGEPEAELVDLRVRDQRDDL